jgi:hypothetical protein
MRARPVDTTLNQQPSSAEAEIESAKNSGHYRTFYTISFPNIADLKPRKKPMQA